MATLRVSASVWSRRALMVARPQIQLATYHRRSTRPLIISKTVGHPRYSTVVEQPTLAPKIDRSASKLFKNADEAVADIQSGSTILSSGFGLCGVAGNSRHRLLVRWGHPGNLTFAFTRNTDLGHASPRSRESSFLDGGVKQCRRSWKRWTFYLDTSRPGQSTGSVLPWKQQGT